VLFLDVSADVAAKARRRRFFVAFSSAPQAEHFWRFAGDITRFYSLQNAYSATGEKF